MTMTFAPDMTAVTPPIHLSAEQVLELLAAHDPETYNHVMRLAANFCTASLRSVCEQMKGTAP